MSVWNYIGEFFLFRWISGKLRKSTILHDTHTEVSGSSIDRGSEYINPLNFVINYVEEG